MRHRGVMDEIAPEVPGYRLTTLLGEGATSRVWRARRIVDDALVAIKILPGEADEEAVREYSLLQHAASEHVVTLHETLAIDGPDGPATALVLELFSGGSLAQVVAARGHLTPGETVTVIAPVAGALSGLHDLGIVHGDLSPGNVLLDSTGRPAVSDLGFSRLTGEPGGDVHGTDGFVAPEIIDGSEPGRPGDVHALGALAWLCLTGRAPGHISERGDLGELVAGEPELVAIVESCLAGDPAARPEADVVARAVFDAVPATPLRMTSPGDIASGLTRRLRESAGVLEVPDWQRELVTAGVPTPRRRWWQRRAKGESVTVPSPGRGRHAAPKQSRGDQGIRETSARETSARETSAREMATRAREVPAPVGLARQIARAATERPGRGRAVLMATGALGLVLALAVPWQQLASADEDETGVEASVVTDAPAIDAPSSDAGAAVLADRAAPQEAPQELAVALTDLRERLVVERDVALLDVLDEPGSPAAERDRDLLEQLTTSGMRFEEVDLQVRSAHLERAGGDVAVLRTTTDEGAYAVVGPDGHRQQREAEYGQRSDLVIVWHEGAWRVRDVR